MSKKKMGTIMKIILGGSFILFGLPILFAMCSLAVRSPEDSAQIRQKVAASQASADAERAVQELADAAKSKDAADKMAKKQLVLNLCHWAQDAVKTQLRAPSSANFPGCVFDADQYEVRGAPDGKTFWVISYVDSQNGFGAMLRTKYVVKFEHPTPEASYNIVQVALE
jgi:hypothetical protein